MNSFDSISQIINAGLLANNGKKVDSCDIQVMIRCFEQKKYSAIFPQMHAWLSNISRTSEFQYIEAINNRTKHTADIASKLAMGIFGFPNTAQIGPFFRKNVQHNEMELNDLLQSSLIFLRNSWEEFLTTFRAEYTKDVYTKNRLHSIDGVYQQKLKCMPDKDFSYAYINAKTTFAAMPDEIYVLLISNEAGDISAYNCPFNTILIVGNRTTDILGRYIANEQTSNDSMFVYRKYVKDKKVQGVECMFDVSQGKTDFYHQNPFFDITTVSDDEEFKRAVCLPF